MSDPSIQGRARKRTLENLEVIDVLALGIGLELDFVQRKAVPDAVKHLAEGVTVVVD